MKDNFGREITYLRVSITDRCNLRCRYCMPLEGVCKNEHTDILTYDEIVKIIKIAAKLGIKKVRLTGGEPLVRKNIVELVSDIKNIDGIEEVCMTTNGLMLPTLGADLKKAGLDRINISLDTLKEEKFSYITRIGKLSDTLAGLDTALTLGFKKVKINTVLIGGFNDDEIIDFAKMTIDKPIDIRFIELMPMYDSGDFKDNAYISTNIIFDKLKENNLEIENKSEDRNGVIARTIKLVGAKGNIGMISAVSNSFCKYCNRLRLTADGKLKPCLHSNLEIPIRGLSDSMIEEKLKEAILRKPKEHNVLSYEKRSETKRNMNEIGG